MNTDPNCVKVSVCLQTYNHGPYIKRSLDGALMQETDFEFEIILGEDESTDGTRAICIDYAHHHPDRIRLFLRSRNDVIHLDGRPTGRFNFIENLKAARGQYIALLDGDDYWTDPHKLQKQADVLDSHPHYALVFHPVSEIDEGGAPLRIIYPPARKSVYSLSELLKGNFIPALSAMFRRPETNFPPDWLSQTPMADWPLHILSATKGDIGYIDHVMGAYRRHAGGVSNQMYQDLSTPAAVRISVLNTLRRHLADQIDDALFRQALSAHYVQLGRQWVETDDVAQARDAWKQALSLNHSNLTALFLYLAALPGAQTFHRFRRIKQRLRPSTTPPRSKHEF
jgi:glycosyltransferase involved in cell wall biosynthesis